MPNGISFFFIFTDEMKQPFTLLAFALLLIIGCKEKDEQSPTVHLIGDGSVTVTLNDTFVDPGATATDETDGELGVSVTGNVDTEMEGNYQLSYRASDAAGNTTTAIRIVSVVNAASRFRGIYQSETWQTPDTANFSAEVSTSTTVNLRIWLVGLGLFSQAVVYADVAGDSLFVPKQHSLILGSDHYFSGSGMILNNDPFEFSINYYDSTSVETKSGKTTYLQLIL
jgi:hypothetical protein